MEYTALIAGASGMVGGEVLNILLGDTDYTRIVSIGRRELPVRHPKLDQVVLDFDELDHYPTLFAVNHIYCCLGTTIRQAGTRAAFTKVDKDYPLKMAELASGQRAMSFSIITAMGSDPTSLIFYNRIKGEVERELQAVNIPCMSVIQPSLLLGQRRDNRMGERVAQSAMRLTSGIMKGPLKKYKAIEGAQVARAMVAVTKAQRKGFARYPNDVLLDY